MTFLSELGKEYEIFTRIPIRLSAKKDKFIDAIILRAIETGTLVGITYEEFKKCYTPKAKLSGKGLSPLEQAEKEIIEAYLVKNNYVKNKTRLQLGITINTLVAKMQKYNLEKPVFNEQAAEKSE